MLENITVREFLCGFTTSELMDLYKVSFKWNNPSLLVVAQQELIKRGESDTVKNILTDTIKKRKVWSNSVLARMMAASLTGAKEDTFFGCLKEYIEETAIEGEVLTVEILQKRIDENS